MLGLKVNSIYKYELDEWDCRAHVYLTATNGVIFNYLFIYVCVNLLAIRKIKVFKF